MNKNTTSFGINGTSALRPCGNNFHRAAAPVVIDFQEIASREGSAVELESLSVVDLAAGKHAKAVPFVPGEEAVSEAPAFASSRLGREVPLAGTPFSDALAKLGRSGVHTSSDYEVVPAEVVDPLPVQVDAAAAAVPAPAIELRHLEGRSAERPSCARRAAAGAAASAGHIDRTEDGRRKDLVFAVTTLGTLVAAMILYVI